MKKDNFESDNKTSNNGMSDASSILNLLKMMNNYKNRSSEPSNAEQSNEVPRNEEVRIEEQQHIETPPTLSRTTRKMLELMKRHDEALARIKNKDQN